jgi:hypothetical protein
VHRTDVQDVISRKVKSGGKVSFTLADPDNIFALIEQSVWEGRDVRSAVEVRENITRSMAILARYQDPAVSVFVSARIPVFRVTEIGEHELQVAHYDREGCGFYGTFLVLRDGDSGEAILFQWFKHYAETERRNAIISQLQWTIARAAVAGGSVGDVTDAVMYGREYGPWRLAFDRQFDWDLTPAIVGEAVAAIFAKIGKATEIIS